MRGSDLPIDRRGTPHAIFALLLIVSQIVSPDPAPRPPAPPRKRPRRGRNLEAEILGGARVVFGRVGFAETSVQDILHESRVSRHSFYRLFDSKADVFGRIVETAAAELLDSVVQATTSAVPGQELRDAVSAYLEWIVGLGSFWRVMESEQVLGASRVRPVREATIARVVELVRNEAQSALGEVPPPELIEALIAAVEALGLRALEAPASLGRMRELAVHVLWRALAPSELAASIDAALPPPAASRGEDASDGSGEDLG